MMNVRCVEENGVEEKNKSTDICVGTLSFFASKSKTHIYYLHRKIRQQGYVLKTKERTIYVPYGTRDFSFQVRRLVNVYGYGIQLFII